MKVYWLCSYPKSGNTWLRVFLNNYIFDRDEPACVNELGLGFAADSRYWVEDFGGMDSADLTWNELRSYRRAAILEMSATQGEPRLLKCHDPYSVLPDGKPDFPLAVEDAVIYLVRNPLDIAVSARSFFGIESDEELLRVLNGTILAKDLLADTAALASRIPVEFVSWSEHVRGWSEALNSSCSPLNQQREAGDSRRPASLLLRYEDLLADPMIHFRRVVEVLGLAYDFEKLKKAVRFSQFGELVEQETKDGFRERGRGAGRFFGSGRSGAGRRELVPKTVDQIISDHDEVMRELGYLP